jgi:hypothetical protein
MFHQGIEAQKVYMWTSRFQNTKEAIKDFKNRGEESFPLEEFCMLRKAMSDWEKRAFYWLVRANLECVCGANIWRTAKTTQLVSAARDEQMEDFEY